MSKKPQKPQKGQPAIKQLYNSVCDIIDYLPSLEVKGDQKSTFVTKSGAGTVIHAAQPFSSTKAKANEYYAGSGIAITSGNIINANLSAGPNIQIYSNSGCLIISGTPEGTGGGGGPDTNTEYIGDYQKSGSGWIWVDQSGTSPRTISSLLWWIKQLKNDPVIGNGSYVWRQDRLSDASFAYDHFLQTRDLLDNKGINTIITSGGWTNNTNPNAITDPETGETINLMKWTGFQVDCVLTGGRFIEVNSHWPTQGGQTPGEIDYEDHTINNLLSGDNVHIFISQQTPNANGSWGGIISTNIHGDETTIHMAADGTLSCIGAAPGPGPTPGGGDLSWPIWQNLAGSANIVWTGVEYTTDSGGWLRISMRGTGGCYGVYIGGNYIGLGAGADTWPLAIPPGSSFLIDFPSGTYDDVMCWFDSNCTPSKVTTGLINYWRFGDEHTYEVTNALNESKSNLNGARVNCTYCKNNYAEMSANWYYYLDHMFDDPPAEPDTIDSYRYWKNEITGYVVQVDDYGTSAITYATSASTANNALGDWKSDLMTTKANNYITSANAYETEASGYQTSAIQIWGYAEQYWQQHDPDYQPESE